MWTLEPQPRATLVDLRDGSRTPLSLTSRPDVDLVEFVAVPAGAAQLWDDGAVILFDSAGQQVQTLNAHQAPSGTCWSTRPASGPRPPATTEPS